mmetsp:Transcript_43438/g.97404  ORF Transcript_43438/g.97404 Transcript_43438/m.97404 type:complete len:226 (-) Transcript_43438:78-755(-)
MSRLAKMRPRQELACVYLALGLFVWSTSSAGDGRSFTEPPRRAVPLLLAGSLALPLPRPAKAGLPLASFSTGGTVDYTVGGAFQVSMPSSYKVLEETPTKVLWQGDRTGQLNTMTAEVEEVDADTLEKALGMENMAIKDIGEKLSDKRPRGGADFYGVQQLQPSGAYRFEFIGDSVHEYVLLALIRKGSQNLLCTVTTRAAGLLWQNNNRFQTFASIMESFKPLV